jgi:hypothetical protein
MFPRSAASTVARAKKRLYVVKRVFSFLVSAKKLKKAETVTTTLLWNDVSKLGEISDEALV